MSAVLQEVGIYQYRHPLESADAPPTSTARPPLNDFCVDAANDGAGGSDLTDTSSIERFDDAYRFASRYIGPADGRYVVVSFWLYPAEDSGYIIGGKQFDDGSEPAAYAFDLKTNRQANYSDAMVAENIVSTLVPAKDIDRVTDEPFRWRVTLEVDSQTVDECEGGTYANPSR